MLLNTSSFHHTTLVCLESAAALAMHPLKGCLVDQEALSDDKIQEILDDAKQRLSCAQSEADPLSVSTKQARPHKPCNIDSSFKYGRSSCQTPTQYRAYF